MDAYIVFQKGNTENAGHMQAENDDHYPADTRHPDAQVVEQTAKGRCRNTKQHKHNAEAKHKSEAMCKGPETIAGPVPPPRGPAAQVTDIRGNKREDAGGKKRGQAGQEC